MVFLSLAITWCEVDDDESTLKTLVYEFGSYLYIYIYIYINRKVEKKSN